MMFSGRRAADLPEVEVEGYQLPLGRVLKYLGVTLDRNLSFTTHVRTVADKAAAAATAVSSLMPNMGGPSTAKRALLQSVASSRLLYAAPVWATRTCQYVCNRVALLRAQRLSSMRIIRSYRTVSAAAALVLAGSLPADLQVADGAVLFQGSVADYGSKDERKRKDQIRERAICKWQRR